MSKVYTVSAAMAIAKAIERAMNMLDNHLFSRDTQIFNWQTGGPKLVNII